MRQYFFLAMAFFIPTAIGAALLWTIGKAIISLFSDWRLGKELDQLEQEGADRREQRRLANEKRLDTGCIHDFETGAFGLPPNVCCKCGLAKEKATGPCDHVWRVQQGPVPSSACEKCGRTFPEAVQQ